MIDINESVIKINELMIEINMSMVQINKPMIKNVWRMSECWMPKFRMSACIMVC